MIFKQTRVLVTDHSGAGWLKTFHLYGGSRRTEGGAGVFLKGSVRFVSKYPPRIRGKKYRPIRVGHVVRGLVVRTAAWERRVDGTRCRSTANEVILIKKRGVLRSKYVFGPVSRKLGRRRYAAMLPSAY